MKKDNKTKEKVLYFFDETEGVFVKSDPKNGYYGKFPGSPEFEVPHSFPAVVRALIEKKAVSKKKYETA